MGNLKEKDNINLLLRLQDFFSSKHIKLIYFISFFYGTVIFLIKSFLLGVHLIGKVKCWGSIHIMRAPGSKINIGDNVSMCSSSVRCTASSIYAPVKLRTFTKTSKIIIENNVSINGTSIASRSKTILIGDGTIIAPNVVIMDSDFHSLWPPDKRWLNPAFEQDEEVIIGKNVWIGSQCIILKGAKIGDNSVIAAGSVVTGVIPENVLAAGTPARIVKSLS